MSIVKKIIISLLTLFVIYLVGVNYVAYQIQDRLNKEYAGKNLGSEEVCILRFDRASKPAFSIFNLSFKLENVSAEFENGSISSIYDSPLEISYSFISRKLSVIQDGKSESIERFRKEKLITYSNDLIELDLPINSFIRLIKSDNFLVDEEGEVDLHILNSIKNVKLTSKNSWMKDEFGEKVAEQKYGHVKFIINSDLFKYNENKELLCNLDFDLHSKTEGVSFDKNSKFFLALEGINKTKWIPYVESSFLDQSKKESKSSLVSTSKIFKYLLFLPSIIDMMVSTNDLNSDVSFSVNIKSMLNLSNLTMPNSIEFSIIGGVLNSSIDVDNSSYVKGKLLYDAEKEYYNLDLDLNSYTNIKSFDKGRLIKAVSDDSEFKAFTENFSNIISDFLEHSPVKFNTKTKLEFDHEKGFKSSIDSFNVANDEYGLSFSGDLGINKLHQFVVDMNIGMRNHEKIAWIYKTYFYDNTSLLLENEADGDIRTKPRKIDIAKLNSFLRAISSTKDGDLNIKLLIPEDIQNFRLGNLTLEELSKVNLLETPLEEIPLESQIINGSPLDGAPSEEKPVE